ncbi:MAG: trigger factor [Candidatus Accumulibacter sp.]|nr:trigger factor [Accumulibacter sp.]
MTQAEAAPAPSALERHLDLAISVADLEKEVTLRLKRIGKTLKIDGFRPGKVPEKIVRQQYGEQARYEALNEMVEKAFYETARDRNLRVAGFPSVSEKAPEATGTPEYREFSAVFEIYPDVVPGDLTGVEIKRPTLEIGQTEIDKTVELLREQHKRYEVTDQPAEMDDRVVIDFFGKINGASFPGGNTKDSEYVIGEGDLLPEFEKAIIGMRAGETRSSEASFPERHFVKELKGQTVTFDVHVKEVARLVLPEIDDELARAFGIDDGDVDKMRAEIEANLRREVKKRLQDKGKDLVMDAILEVTPIDIPKALIDRETQRLMRSAVEEMEQIAGVQARNIPVKPEWFVGKATRRVGLGLIFAEIVKENDLKAQPAQVKAVIEELAQGYENPEEVVRWYYAEPHRLTDVEARVLEDNVVAWALERANVVDDPVDFDKLMGQKAHPPVAVTESPAVPESSDEPESSAAPESREEEAQ